jgi:hypothetical protein
MFNAMRVSAALMLERMFENWTTVSTLFLEPPDVYLVYFAISVFKFGLMISVLITLQI